MTLTRDQLISRFTDAETPREKWLIGGEFERHLLDASGMPLNYFGEPGVQWLMKRLVARGPWAPIFEGEHIISLLHPTGANITLEPGGQFELSEAPYREVSKVVERCRSFAQLLDEELEGTSIRQVGLGFTPYAHIPEIPWVPKGRYTIMRTHLGQTGALAHHMMKGTAAVQCSYDFESAQDCQDKVRLATGLAPLTTALFANSPYDRGSRSAFASFRGHIWTQTDPARTGLPDAASEFSYESWVDYLLDAPMMFFKQQGQWKAANGLTFREWMAFDEHGPTWADWELHQTSVFPEVRVKQTIEVRGADCVPVSLAGAFCALWTGLFYDDHARNAALELAQQFTQYGSKSERFDTACRQGLRGQVGPHTLTHWAEQTVDIARAGLERWCPTDVSTLQPLVDQVSRGESPADTLVRIAGETPSPEALFAATQYSL